MKKIYSILLSVLTLITLFPTDILAQTPVQNTAKVYFSTDRLIGKGKDFSVGIHVEVNTSEKLPVPSGEFYVVYPNNSVKIKTVTADSRYFTVEHSPVQSGIEKIVITPIKSEYQFISSYFSPASIIFEAIETTSSATISLDTTRSKIMINETNSLMISSSILNFKIDTQEQNLADLYLHTRQASLRPGEQFSVDFILKPNNVHTSLVKTVITYPTESIELLDTTYGPLFQLDLDVNTKEAGKIQLGLATGLLALNSQKTEGIIATFNFRTKEQANSAIQFNFDTANTQILSLNGEAAENMIGETEPLIIPVAYEGEEILLVGDANDDKKVDIFDYNALTSEFLRSVSSLKSDFNKNGKVDVQDYNLLVTNFGKI
jgi:hypothetical protein